MPVQHIGSYLFAPLEVRLLFGPDWDRFGIQALKTSLRTTVELYLFWISAGPILIGIFQSVDMFEFSQKAGIVCHVSHTVGWLSLFACFSIMSKFRALRICFKKVAGVLLYHLVWVPKAKMGLIRHFRLKLLVSWDNLSLLSTGLFFLNWHTWVYAPKFVIFVIFEHKLWRHSCGSKMAFRICDLEITGSIFAIFIDLIFISHHYLLLVFLFTLFDGSRIGQLLDFEFVVNVLRNIFFIFFRVFAHTSWNDDHLGLANVLLWTMDAVHFHLPGQFGMAFHLWISTFNNSWKSHFRQRTWRNGVNMLLFIILLIGLYTCNSFKYVLVKRYVFRGMVRQRNFTHMVQVCSRLLIIQLFLWLVWLSQVIHGYLFVFLIARHLHIWTVFNCCRISSNQAVDEWSLADIIGPHVFSSDNFYFGYLRILWVKSGCVGDEWVFLSWQHPIWLGVILLNLLSWLDVCIGL